LGSLNETTRCFGAPPVSITVRQQQEANMAFEQKDKANMSETDGLVCDPKPTFVCNFSDGEQTRMTVHCGKGLDVARGVKLARYAYESRKGKTPPAMRDAAFVSSDDGITLMLYSAQKLNSHD
jgi:hypothetical protein